LDGLFTARAPKLSSHLHRAFFMDIRFCLSDLPKQVFWITRVDYYLI